MRQKPMLQLAIDDLNPVSSFKMAVIAGPYADVIEIGSPLCRCAGKTFVSSISELLPDKLILADYKFLDGGNIEAKLAHESGANFVTAVGIAPAATIQSALDYTSTHEGIEVIMEMTGIRDILTKVKEWREIGVERFTYHLGYDEEHFDRKWSQSDLDTIGKMIEMGCKVSVTGGINYDLLPFFKDLDISICICGRSITQSEDPVESIKRIQDRVSQIWS